MKYAASILLCLVFLTACHDNMDVVESPNQIDFEYDDSDRTDVIKITSPAEYSIYFPGDTVFINWTSSMDHSSIRIDLTKKTIQKRRVTNYTENTGNYFFIIPDDLTPSHHYQFKLMDVDRHYVYSYSKVFFVDKKVISNQ